MATKAKQQCDIGRLETEEKAVVAIVQQLGRTRGVNRVFSDLMEISAIALARMDISQFEAREARYLQIVGEYEKSEVHQLVSAFSHLVMAYEHLVAQANGFADVLGQIYMQLDLGNSKSGQFFTPYEVSLLIAKLQVSDAKKLVDEHGFVLLSEPACGAGAMIIAAAQVFAEENLNYQQCMHVTAVDIDARCVHMTFIQLALLGIPAVVIHGNTLSLEVTSQWYTPAHFLGGWSAKLPSRSAKVRVDNENSELAMPGMSSPEAIASAVVPALVSQMALF